MVWRVLKSCIHPLIQNDSFLFQVKRDSPESRRIMFSSQLLFSDFTDEADSDEPSTVSAYLPYTSKTLKAVTFFCQGLWLIFEVFFPSSLPPTCPLLSNQEIEPSFIQHCLSSHCHSKIPQAGCLNRHFFFTVLESGKSRI